MRMWQPPASPRPARAERFRRRPAEAGRPAQTGSAASDTSGRDTRDRREPCSVEVRVAGDLADVLGQPVARRAVEICAAGGHHLSMLGPPGAGKTMLAERLPTVLPRLDLAASLEVTSVHSVAGALPPGCPLVTEPPFCGPHHTATKAAIVGGGSGIIRPGAVSLAHLGVLFLDEAPEFSRDVLDALRQPLESGEVVVARSGLTARFPASFTLVLAANPCPCARAAGPRAALHLHAHGQAQVPGPAVRSAARPGRRQGRASSCRQGRAAERPAIRRDQRDRGQARRAGA